MPKKPLESQESEDLGSKGNKKASSKADLPKKDGFKYLHEYLFDVEVILWIK